MPAWVRSERQQDVAVLTIDNAPVNVLTPGVPEEIAAAIAAANRDASVRAIVLTGAGRGFVAGADVNQFTGGDPRPYLQTLADCNYAVEDSAKPVVVAIHGNALGAGLELALSAHYRVLDASAAVGQPEVKLGLIPGAGATQRLPRLVGAVKAAHMCASGEPLNAHAAKTVGLADRIVDDNLLRAAVSFAREIAGEPVRKTRERQDKLSLEDRGKLEHLRGAVRKLRRGEDAPLAALDAIEASLHLAFEDGLQREQELFLNCLGSQAPAMIHLFFAERAAAKLSPPPVEKETAEEENVTETPDAPLVFATAPDTGLRRLEGVIYLDHPGTRLVEIVRGEHATAQNIQAAFAHAKLRNKVAVLVNGFAGDHLYRALLEEALQLTRDGARVADVNNALLEFGMARGPLVKDGIAGGGPIAAEEIVHHITSALHAECLQLLEKGVVQRGSDIDVILVLGYGYPAWRGGPMYAAEQHTEQHTEQQPNAAEPAA